MPSRQPSCARPPSARGQRKRLIEEPPEQDIRADGRRYAEPAKKGRPTGVRDFGGFERIDMVMDLYRMKAGGMSTAEAKAEVTTTYVASVKSLERFIRLADAEGSKALAANNRKGNQNGSNLTPLAHLRGRTWRREPDTTVQGEW